MQETQSQSSWGEMVRVGGLFKIIFRQYACLCIIYWDEVKFVQLKTNHYEMNSLLVVSTSKCCVTPTSNSKTFYHFQGMPPRYPCTGFKLSKSGGC